MITRETFAETIAPLADYRRLTAWKFVYQLEHLIRALDHEAQKLGRAPGALLTPQEVEILEAVKKRQTP